MAAPVSLISRYVWTTTSSGPFSACQGHPAVLVLAMIFIIDRHGQFVREHRSGLLEADAVFTAVGDGLVGIPFKVILKRHRSGCREEGGSGDSLRNSE